MLKNLTRLECTVEGKVGHFYCDIDCPLHIAKEMIFQLQKYIGQVEDNAKAQYDEQQAQAKAKAEEEANKLKECCQDNGELCLVKE